MPFFTSRERAALSASADTDVEEKIRAVVRRDFAPLRQPQAQDYAPRQQRREHDLTGNIGSQLQQIGEASLMEVDSLIVELQRQREKLLSDSARVQHDIVEFARLSQSTMQSTKIIAESLIYWNKVPDAPAALSTPASVEKAADEERHESAANTATSPRDDIGDRDEATTVQGRTSS
jgi:hypothetical protein